MRASTKVGAAFLIAGIVGTVLFVAWFFEYQRGLGGFLTDLRGPLQYIVLFGSYWGSLSLVVAYVLLSWTRWGRHEARGRIRRDLGLRDLGFAALAAAIGIAIAVALQVGFVRFDSTFIILTAWGIPAILMYALLTWTRRHDRVLRVARPIGVTLGWSLAWLLSVQGAFAALGTSIFLPIVYVAVIALLWGIPVWLSMLLTEWVVRALLHLH